MKRFQVPPFEINVPPDLQMVFRRIIDCYNDESFTGSVTVHFQDGIVREIEQHTRKRLRKQT